MEKEIKDRVSPKKNQEGAPLLIVDDEEDICHVLSKVLIREGYRVVTALDAQQALQLVKKEKPRLVILDIMMPDMDGLSLLDQLRQVDESLVVIMLTAYGSIQTAQKAMSCGAYDYITKPWDNQMVVSLVAEALQE